MRALTMVLAMIVIGAPVVFAAGMPANSPGTTSMSNQEEEAFNRMSVNRNYGIPMSDIDQLRQQGYSWATINMMANAAYQTRQPIMTIANLRAQGMDWCDIADRYNVACASLTGPFTTAAVVTPSPAVTGAGPMAPRYIYNTNGGIFMTENEAMRYYAMGYDWTEVAVAANIAQQLGIPMERVLARFRTGITMTEIIRQTGIDPCTALNVTMYPFERRSIYGPGQSEKRLQDMINCAGCSGLCVPACPGEPCPAEPCPPEPCPPEPCP